MRKGISFDEVDKTFYSQWSKVGSLMELLDNRDIKYTIELCWEFREMVNGNIKQRSLQKWINNAMTSESQAMRDFAAGIKADQ